MDGGRVVIVQWLSVVAGMTCQSLGDHKIPSYDTSKLQYYSVGAEREPICVIVIAFFDLSMQKEIYQFMNTVMIDNVAIHKLCMNLGFDPVQCSRTASDLGG